MANPQRHFNSTLNVGDGDGDGTCDPLDIGGMPPPLSSLQWRPPNSRRYLKSPPLFTEATASDHSGSNESDIPTSTSPQSLSLPEQSTNYVEPALQVYQGTTTSKTWTLTCDALTCGEGEKPTWYGAPLESYAKCHELTLLVEARKKDHHDHLYFTPVFPVDLWGTELNLAEISEQLNGVLDDLDPSVCLGERPNKHWLRRALNTLQWERQSSIKVAEKSDSVRFGEAPKDTNLESGCFYPDRTQIIEVDKRRR